MDKEEEYIIPTIQSNRPLNIDESVNENEDEKEIKSNDVILENEEQEFEEEEEDFVDDEKELLTNYIKYQNIIVDSKEDEYEDGLKLKI